MAMFVTSKAQAIENIGRYNEALTANTRLPREVLADLRGTLIRARAWYAVKKGDSWLLGPSKFIGYAEMTPGMYSEGRQHTLDGRMTESVLGQWSKEVGNDHPAFAALRELCSQHGTKPNSLARIAIFETDETVVTDRDAKIVDLLVEMAGLLPDQHRTVLKRRVASL